MTVPTVGIDASHLGFGSRLDQRTSLLEIAPGQVAGLVGPPGYGLTRLGLTMLAPHASVGMVAVLDVRGLSVASGCMGAWHRARSVDHRPLRRSCEMGQGRIDADRWCFGLVCGGSAWREGHATAHPRCTGPDEANTDVAPSGATCSSRRYRPVEARRRRSDLEGTDLGHGRLTRRRVVLTASGKAMWGMEARIELEDDGTDAVHLVPRLATAADGLPSDEPAQAVDENNRVIAVNGVARAAGVRIGMRRREAEGVVPAVHTVVADPAAETSRFEPVAAAIESLIPRIEIAMPGLVYTPIAGAIGYYGDEVSLIERVVKEIDHITGSGYRIGLASGRFSLCELQSERLLIGPSSSLRMTLNSFQGSSSTRSVGRSWLRRSAGWGS